MRKLAALVTPTCGQESSIAAARRTLTGIQHCCCATHENDTVRSVLVSACEGTCLVLCLHGGPLGPISCLAAEGIQTSRCRSAQHREAPGAKGQDTHTHTCTQAMHMQDSCTLALLCSGPPVGVGRASLRRFWKGKRPLGAATQCRESMATEPEVATRAQAARGPPHARTSERGSKRACHSSQQLASHPASQPASRPGSLVASCSGRSLVRRPLYLRKHRPIAHMTFPSHSRFAQSVCCFLQALKKHTLKH
jgi:hypothetical protein